MKELSLKEIQQRLNSLLKELKAVFEEHNIKYFLCGGTLLGAVRHKGFIPWDDDIDVIVTPDGYEKLIELQLQGKIKKNILQCIEANKNFKLPFARYTDTETLVTYKIFRHRFKKSWQGSGLFIDILPTYGMGNDWKKAQKLQRKISFLARLNYWVDKPWFIKMLWLIPPVTPMFFLQGFFFKRSLKLANKYPFETSKYTSPRNMIGILHPKEMIEETTMIPFEGELYSVPKKYHEYLAWQYGDYMELPPEHKRVTHGIRAFVPNEN